MFDRLPEKRSQLFNSSMLNETQVNRPLPPREPDQFSDVEVEIHRQEWGLICTDEEIREDMARIESELNKGGLSELEIALYFKNPN